MYMRDSLGAIDPLTPERPPEPVSSGWAEAAKGLTTAATAYLSYEQQRRLMKENERRLRAGLPPLDASAFSPQVRVQHEVAGIDPKLLLGLGALALVFLLRK